MQYRKFGPIDFKVSSLGFGAMRLPVNDNDPQNIKEEEAISMIRYAIDQGVNYIDTAYPYHGECSELLVGKALRDGYRDKVKLATKFPIWLPKTAEECPQYLEEQLEKLETECIDFYLVHNLNKGFWKKTKDLKVLDFLIEAKKQGKIKYIGFSFHDELPLFKEIIDSFPWDFCQIQLNYMDEDYQAGLEGLYYADMRNIPVIVMEPLQGGNLAKEPPQDIKAIWEKADKKRSPAQWGLRWVLNHPEVKLVLSGMSTMEQVKDNIKTMDRALPNSLTEKELILIEQVKNKYKEKVKVGCTDCKYCMPCPNDVNIPENFSLYNKASMYDHWEKSKKAYANLKEKNLSANFCIECGQCEPQCPQGIPIIEKLKEVNSNLSR